MPTVERHIHNEHPTNTPSVVSPQAWKAARQQLLVQEKELTRARDALAAARRRMPPWRTPGGRRSPASSG
jgi:predicted dithiol-disulfide oxidoreductase (DUF899 family)